MSNIPLATIETLIAAQDGDILPTRSYGIIGICKHRIDCLIGIYPAEREQVQMIYVDVKIKVDITASIHSGKVQDSVDYVAIAQVCTELAQRKNYRLLETFASDILDHCKNHFKACWAWVHIQKPSAIPSADYAFVEMEYQEKEGHRCGR